jgi:predicted dehydrogenase
MKKIAVLGCGAIAGRWVRALQGDDRVQVVALIDPDQAAARRVRERTAPPTDCFPSLEAALSATRLDAVANLTPPPHHESAIRSALEAGLSVLSEKPLTTTLSTARALTDLARARGLVLGVMRNHARDPGFTRFAETVRAAPGPRLVTAETLVPLYAPGFRAGTPYIATADLAAHVLDQVRELIDACPQEIGCYEQDLPFLGAHCSLATVTVGFADGSALSYRGGFTADRTVRTSAAGTWRAETAGSAALWPGSSQPDPGGPSGHAVCVTEMIDALRGASRPAITAELHLGTVALLEAALTAARTGQNALVDPTPWAQSAPCTPSHHDSQKGDHDNDHDPAADRAHRRT